MPSPLVSLPEPSQGWGGGVSQTAKGGDELTCGLTGEGVSPFAEDLAVHPVVSAVDLFFGDSQESETGKCLTGRGDSEGCGVGCHGGSLWYEYSIAPPKGFVEKRVPLVQLSHAEGKVCSHAHV